MFERWNRPVYWAGEKPVWAGFTFRVPEEWGERAAIERARWELGIKDPVVWPATPFQILRWFETHPEEERFRALRPEVR